MNTTRKSRILVLVPHQGSGIVSPMVNELARRFEVVDVVHVEVPPLVKLGYLISTFHPVRQTWFERWMRMREKTPSAFKTLTRRSEDILSRYASQIDGVVQFGAMHSLGRYARTLKYVIVTDSTRKLSASNAADGRSRFLSPAEAGSWYHLEAEHYRHARGILARSTPVGESLAKDYGVEPGRIRVCNFGSGLALTEKSFRKNYDGRTILFVGKGNFEEKGGVVALRAFDLIKAAVPDAQLHIVGQDQEFSVPGVVSHGRLRDRDALRALYEQAHVFILPSYTDRFGMSLVEAMSAYTPCVASNYAAMPDIVGDAGCVIERGDVDDLAKKVIGLLRDVEACRALGAKARERYDNHLSWDAVGKNIFGFITECLDA